MDLEQYFISALMRSGEMGKCAEARITTDYFNDEDHRRVFEFITKYYTDYGRVPAASQVKRNWPTYGLVSIDHPIEYYIRELSLSHLNDELLYVLSDVQEAMERRDPEQAMEIMASSLSHLAPITSTAVDEDLTETWEDRLEQYEEYREMGGLLRGLPTGFNSIDRATLGLQPGQFNVLIGLPKAGKSTLLLAMALAVHAHGAKPLLVGFEMTNSEQAARYDAMVAHVDHLMLLGGRITKEQIRTLEEIGKEREGFPAFVVSADIASATTVTGIAAKIDQHKPGAVFIDGLYLMDDEHGEPKGSSQALTNITRGLARLAKQKMVNITGTTQVLHSKVSRTSGVTAASVGYSSSFAQDCHVLISVEATEEDGIQELKVLLSRSGPRVTTQVLWDWSTGTFEELDEEEVAASG